MTLKRAREKRDEAHRVVADGVDPSAKCQAERAAEQGSGSGDHGDSRDTRLKSFLYPYVGSRPLMEITAQELLAALRRIEARGKHETAHRVRALAGSVLRFAVATGGLSGMWRRI